MDVQIHSYSVLQNVFGQRHIFPWHACWLQSLKFQQLQHRFFYYKHFENAFTYSLRDSLNSIKEMTMLSASNKATSAFVCFTATFSELFLHSTLKACSVVLKPDDWLDPSRTFLFLTEEKLLCYLGSVFYLFISSLFSNNVFFCFQRTKNIRYD